ncbi:UNVERIFIED_CONTAM: hypothetical protein HDU68_005394 [Siphonaria sp. JEL0065]|nr:hypothetical protein HDU68_005394 [Siphonaria sp. JEL0065]
MKDHFKVVENINVSSRDDYATICKAVTTIAGLGVSTSPICAKNNKAVYQLAVLLHPSKTQFAFYTTLCHGIGDSYSFFALYKMLASTTVPYAMIFDRIKIEEAFATALPDYANDIKSSSMAIKSSVWASISGPSEEWIKEQKEIAIKDGGFVSTNDCIASWFFKKTNCEYASIAVNMRNRVENVTDLHFGNYQGLV